MSPRKLLLIISLIGSVLCLAAGYAIAGYWIGAVIAVLLGAAWLLARKYVTSSLASFCLWGSAALAVVGLLTGSVPLLMILGSALALCAWDLLLLDAALGSRSSAEPTRRYENAHLRSLLIAIGSALAATFLGRFITIQVPFLVLILSIAFLLFALDRVLSSIKKTGL